MKLVLVRFKIRGKNKIFKYLMTLDRFEEEYKNNERYIILEVQYDFFIPVLDDLPF